jgi:hypothetical protein
MRIVSLLRVGTLALALSAAVTATAPAFAAAVNDSTQAQAQDSNYAPYDGAASEAAKHAFY